jgi:hypothetical protein
LNDIAPVPVEPKTMTVTVADHVLEKFLADGQEPAIARQMYDRASQMLIDGEGIEYIAVANKAAVGNTFECVIASNKRLIDFKKKMFGKLAVDDCFWRDVQDFDIKEVRHDVSLTIETIQGWRLSVEGLPWAQALRLCEVGAGQNARLQKKWQELLGASMERESDYAASREPAAPQRGPLTQDREYSNAGRETAPAPAYAPITGPLTALPAVGPSMEPLRLDFSSMDPFEEWQATQATPTAQASPTPAPVEGATLMPPSLSGIDELFAPLLEQETPGYGRPSGASAEASPRVTGPELVHVNGQVEERKDREAVGAYLVNYQVNAQNSPYVGTTNGNGNGINRGSNGTNNGNGVYPPQMKAAPVAEPVRTQEEHPSPSQAMQTHAEVPILEETMHSETRDSASQERKKSSAPAYSPMRKLRQLKRMLDAELITQDDYEVKKTDILSHL